MELTVVCFLVCAEPWVQSLAQYKLGLVAHFCNSSTWEMKENQMFKVTLSYIEKKKSQKNQQRFLRPIMNSSRKKSKWGGYPFTRAVKSHTHTQKKSPEVISRMKTWRHWKIKLKNILEDIKTAPRVGKINIVKMLILSKAICRLNEISLKFQWQASQNQDKESQYI